MVDDISHEGLRVLLREEGVTFQRLKTWKTSKDPDYAVKKARVEHLYAIADGEVVPDVGRTGGGTVEPSALNWSRPGRQWAAVSGKNAEPGRAPRPRMRATYTRTAGIRHLLAAYDLHEDKLFRAHQVPQDPHPVPGILPVPALPLPTRHPHRDHLRQLQPAPDHRQRHPGRRLGRRQQRRTRLYADQLVMAEPDKSPVRRPALFALDGTDHASHKEQASMMRRYIIWRNNHAYDERLRRSSPGQT